jgi:GNAT superfamily N-acetyltransferase
VTVDLRPLSVDDTDTVAELARLASQRFREAGYPNVADDEPFTADELTPYVAGGRGWVATDESGGVVGYVLVDVVDGGAHIEQVTVHPGHQGTGIGRMLVEWVAAWAAEREMTVLTLTTFTDVSWNRPLYEHLGFTVLDDTDIGPELRELRNAEAAHGLDPAVRVCMRRAVTPPNTASSGARNMSTAAASFFCDTKLAHRIERAEVDLIRAVNDAAGRRGAPSFLIPVAGGVASFADEGSPYNKVAGWGFDGVPGLDELDAIEGAFAARGAPTQVELAHLADPAIGELLTARGYRLESFENVLGRSLDRCDPWVSPSDIEVRLSPDDEFDDWLRVVADAAAHPDSEGLARHEEFPRAIYEQAQRDAAHAGVRRYSAWRAGSLAGGAELRLVGDIAQFAGAATAPAHRRHGIQSAFLSRRLADAVAEGCDVAVIVVQPGSKSQQNAQRSGFHLLYTRAILVKPAASSPG